MEKERRRRETKDRRWGERKEMRKRKERDQRVCKIDPKESRECSVKDVQ